MMMIHSRGVYILKCFFKIFTIPIKIINSGPDGLKFLKDDIKVSKEGLIKMYDGNNNSVVHTLTRDDIEVFFFHI